MTNAKWSMQVFILHFSFRILHFAFSYIFSVHSVPSVVNLYSLELNSWL